MNTNEPQKTEPPQNPSISIKIHAPPETLQKHHISKIYANRIGTSNTGTPMIMITVAFEPKKSLRPIWSVSNRGSSLILSFDSTEDLFEIPIEFTDTKTAQTVFKRSHQIEIYDKNEALVLLF